MRLIAHRGASATHPENTLAAVAEALRLGVYAIEIDVFIIENNGQSELVVLHDRWLQTTTNGQGLVTAQTLSAIRKLDAGQGQQVPTLAEVLALVAGRCLVNIEIKNNGAVAKVHQAIDFACQHQGFSPAQFLISSFNHPELKISAQRRPDIALAALIAHIPLSLEAMVADLPVIAVNICIDCLNAELVNNIKALGLAVFVYTVNERIDIEYLSTLGVDGVFCNHPLEISQFLQQIHGQYTMTTLPDWRL